MIKRTFFRSTVFQSPLRPTGIVAGFGAAPLIRKARGDIQQGKRIGLFPFPTAACALALVTGEALAAFEIIWILAIGMLLEGYVTERAQRAIRDILEVAPAKTLVLADGREAEKAVAGLRVGDTVVVKTGMTVPAEGVVLKDGPV